MTTTTSKSTKKTKKKSSEEGSTLIKALESTYAWQYICDNKFGKENIQILDYSPPNKKDVEWLRKQGYNADTYSPNKDPKPKQKYDIVISKYLLNKIDNDTERNNVLYNIGNLTTGDGSMFLVSSKRKEKKLSDYCIFSNKHFSIYFI